MEDRLSPRTPTSRVKHLLLGSLSAALVAATGANAASVLGDQFQIEGTVSGESFGPATGIAGQPVGTFDVEATAGPDINVRVRWVDEDSFDVLIEMFPPTGLEADVTLSDLNFKTSSAQAVDVIGASFNPNANGYLGYFKSDENPTGANRPADPIVSWTPSSVRVQYGSDWETQLIADQPVLRFDVTAVPEPGTLAMVLAGLGGLGLVRRRNGSNG